MPNIEENTNEWISIALYDLETAQAMFDTGRYLYVVFMCQQAIEKLLKALFIHKTQKMPPSRVTSKSNDFGLISIS